MMEFLHTMLIVGMMLMALTCVTYGVIQHHERKQSWKCGETDYHGNPLSDQDIFEDNQVLRSADK